MRGGEYSLANIMEHMANQDDEIYIFQERNGDSIHKNIKIFTNKNVDFIIEKISSLNINKILTWSSGVKETYKVYKRIKISYVYNVRFWRNLLRGGSSWKDNWIKKKVIKQKPNKHSAKFFKNASKIISNSNYVKRVVNKFYNLENIVIPPPVDPEKIVVKDNLDKRYITVIGDCLAAGHNLNLKLARVLPNYDFWSIGYNFEGNIPDNLKITKNYLKDRKEVFRKTKLMLCPRQFDETFGRVVLESMYNGIPVIISVLEV